MWRRLTVLIAVFLELCAANVAVKRSIRGQLYQDVFPSDISDKSSLTPVLIHHYCNGFNGSALHLNDDFTEYSICGGSLFGDQYVLTAAHCFLCDYKLATDSLTTRVFYGGTCHPTPESSCSPESVVKTDAVSFIAVHPNFNANNPTTNDIAIIRLTHQLPAPSPLRLFTGDTVMPRTLFVSGFGSDLFLPNAVDHLLKTVTLTMHSCDDIPEALSDNLCSITRDSDVCEGDSGSGLIDTNKVLYGIVSAGNPCEDTLKGVRDFSGLFTDVSKHLGFICSYVGNAPQCLDF